jgi:hypothetical protein
MRRLALGAAAKHKMATKLVLKVFLVLEKSDDGKRETVNGDQRRKRKNRQEKLLK